MAKKKPLYEIKNGKVICHDPNHGSGPYCGCMFVSPSGWASSGWK